MDPNLVYQKTSAGEEAMRQRTKVVQRNQRMVLILVDGKATVAELCDKTTNPQMTVAVLRELEKDGFVVPLSAIESAWMWEQSRKIAQEIKAAVSRVPHRSARKKSTQRKAAADQSSEPRVLPVKAEGASPRLPAPEAGLSAAARKDNYSTFSTFETEAQVREAMRRQLETFEGVKKEEADVKPSPRRRTLRRTKDSDDSQIKPIRRGERTSGFGWVGRFALLFLLTCVVVLGAILLFPYGRYLQEIELALSQGVGKPAKIDAVSVALFPRPGLFLRGVRLGADSAVESLRLAEIRLLPEVSSLLSSRVVLRDVEVNGLNLVPGSLMALPGLFAAMKQTTSPFAAHSVVLGNAGFSLGSLSFSGLHGRVDFDAAQSMRALSLETADRKLRVEVIPANASADVSLEGHAWKPSEGGALVFDSLKIKGVLLAEAFRAETIDARFFDGSIHGAAEFDATKNTVVTGRFSYERLNAKKLGEIFGATAFLEGEASGRVEFSSLVDASGGLMPALTAGGDFVVRRGALLGFDLAEAIRRASTSPVRGGRDAFRAVWRKFQGTAGRSSFDESFPGFRFDAILRQYLNWKKPAIVGRDECLDARFRKSGFHAGCFLRDA